MQKGNKNFRSGKNLRQLINHHIIQNKDQPSLLKIKIKSLEQQIQLLKKTNLNIYIPLSQKQTFLKQQNKDEIIKKLRISLLKEQQQNQINRNQIKKLQKEKEVIKITFDNQLQRKNQQIFDLKSSNQQLQQEIQSLSAQLQQQRQKRQSSEKQVIQMRVQLRFIKQDLQSYKCRYQQSTKKLTQLKSLVLQVQFNSKIYKSSSIKITAIQTSQLNQLKNCIYQLEREIQQLLFKLANPKKQQKVSFNVNTKNIGEQIVRLKKNIDLQLGFKSDQNVIKSFLDKYEKTNDKFKELIDGCKNNITQ